MASGHTRWPLGKGSGHWRRPTHSPTVPLLGIYCTPGSPCISKKEENHSPGRAGEGSHPKSVPGIRSGGSTPAPTGRKAWPWQLQGNEARISKRPVLH